MSSRPDLRIDWATHAAAKYAVENWHYSKRMPVGKLVKVGAWEGDVFIGCVVFSWGANRHLAGSFGLPMTECVELVRVALRGHSAPVSRIVSMAVKFLRRQSVGIRLLVSFSDPAHGHHGGIYQAMNWIYSGTTSRVTSFRRGGVTLMRRAYTGRQFGTGLRAKVPTDAEPFISPGKHRYLYPLDEAMRAQIAPLSKPYPRRPKQAMAGTTGTAEGQHLPGRSIESDEVAGAAGR